MSRKDFIPAAAAPPPKGRALLISPRTLSALQDRVGEVIILDPTQFDRLTRGGKTFYRLRDKIEFPPAPGGGGGAAVLGLQIVNGSEAGKYRVTPGYINGEIPTFGSVALDAEEPPEFTVNQTTHVWGKCVGTFGTPDSYVTSIVTQTSFGVPAGTEITGTGFTSFYRIGRVQFTAGDPPTYQIFNDHSGGNLGVDSWGLYNLWWRA